MWDSFTSGVATSIMRNSHNHDGENDFAEMEYMNITVVTSNKPYGVHDGSNPLFHGRAVPKFFLKKGGVHSGHVQTGLRDPFCIVENGKGKCQVVACLAFLTFLCKSSLVEEYIHTYMHTYIHTYVHT
jgi:hypothetical protein